MWISRLRSTAVALLCERTHAILGDVHGTFAERRRSRAPRERAYRCAVEGRRKEACLSFPSFSLSLLRRGISKYRYRRLPRGMREQGILSVASASGIREYRYSYTRNRIPRARSSVPGVVRLLGRECGNDHADYTYVLPPLGIPRGISRETREIEKRQ